MLFYYPKSSSPCVHAWVLGGGGGGGGGTSMGWWYVHGGGGGGGGGACMGPRGGGGRGGACMGPRGVGGGGGGGGWYIHGLVVCAWGGGVRAWVLQYVHGSYRAPPPTTPSSTISLCTTSLRQCKCALQECRVGVLYMECIAGVPYMECRVGVLYIECF